MIAHQTQQQQQTHASVLTSSARRRRGTGDGGRIADTSRKSALTDRLKGVLIWSLTIEGETDCRRMTLRDLYEHILEAIVKQSKAKPPVDTASSSTSTTTGTTGSSTPARSRIPRQSSVGTTGSPSKQPERREKGKRLGGYLHPRDLRKIVSPLSIQNEPELIVRRHVILLNFDHIKAIVLRDRILVPVLDGDTSTLIDLERRIQRGCEDSILEEEDYSDEPSEKMSSSQTPNIDAKSSSDQDAAATTETDATTKHGSPTTTTGKPGNRAEDVIKQIDAVDDLLDDFDEWADMSDRSWVNLPFELQCVDAVLTSNVQLISQDISTLTSEIYDIIENILSPDRSSIEVEHYRDKLRRSKNDAGEMASLVQGFVRAIQCVLNEDEDMALMNLSHLLTRPERFIQPVSDAILEEESDEPELILEAYLQQGLTTINAMDYLKTILANTDALIDQKLDTIRNRLLYVNTIVGLLSFIVATGSLVGSFFGMNLTNFLEDDENAFRQVVIGTVVGLFCMLLFLIWMFIRVGGLPKSI